MGANGKSSTIANVVLSGGLGVAIAPLQIYLIIDGKTRTKPFFCLIIAVQVCRQSTFRFDILLNNHCQ
jgi:hypothetical protein